MKRTGLRAGNRMKYSETLTAGQAQPGYLRDNVAAKPQGS